MINFIDLLNWAATIFVWVLGIGIVGSIIVWLLGGFAPPKSKREQAQATQEKHTATPFESRVWGACVALWFMLAIATVLSRGGYL